MYLVLVQYYNYTVLLLVHKPGNCTVGVASMYGRRGGRTMSRVHGTPQQENRCCRIHWGPQSVFDHVARRGCIHFTDESFELKMCVLRGPFCTTKKSQMGSRPEQARSDNKT